MPNRVLRAAVAVLALALPACAGQPSTPAPTGLDGLLPSPLELARASSDSPAERLLEGDQYSSTAPSARVTASGTDAEFVPLPQGFRQDYVAYATYSFSNPDFSGAGAVLATWNTPPDDCYIGVANYALNTWEWTQCTPGVETTTPLSAADMISPSGEEHVVILVAGSTTAVLDSVRIGGTFVQPNQPPVAWIQAGNFEIGGYRRTWTYVGRDIEFSFEGCHDLDGWIDHFNIDYESDGTYDRFYVGTQTTGATWTPSSPGIYTVTVRATDNDGAQSTASCEVTVIGDQSYDEIEPNGTFDTCQPLTLPCEHFAACTTGAGDQDWYCVDVPTDQILVCECRMEELEQVSCAPFMQLIDTDGSTVLKQEGKWPFFMYDLTAGTYFLKVTDESGGDHDYELNIKLIDGPITAEITPLPATLPAGFNQQFQAVATLSDGSILPLDCDVQWDVDNDAYFEDGYKDYSLRGEASPILTCWDPGDWTINVTVTDHQGNVTTDSVTLTVTGTYFETEPNDTVAEADSLDPLAPDPNDPSAFLFDQIDGQVMESGPPGTVEDFYAFTVPDKGNLILYFNHFQPQHGDTIEIRDVNGVTVLSTVVTQYCGANIQTYLPAGGTYYIHIVVNGADPNDPNEGGGYIMNGQFRLDGGST